MNIPTVRALLFAGALCALGLRASAQIVELRATIDQSQENPATGSPARGNAIMLYDVGSNTFDLMVSITGLSNVAANSHIHEAAVGVNGPVVTGLGGDAVYTRSGTSLTGTFRSVKHLGDPLKLLQGGAYYNLHSAQFPGGEIRGQLIPQPVRLYAVIDVPQEAAASAPTLNFSGLNDRGGAVMYYDPMTNLMRLRLSLFNFNNTFSNSHFHTEIPGKSGGVTTNLGNTLNTTFPNGGTYTNANGYIAGSFDIPMTGTSPIALLLGTTYLNFHSNVFGGGEVRGQVYVSEERPGTRFANTSVRGFVGTGDQVLIQGINITGDEPIRALITAKGPSLTAAGVAGALPNPRLELYDSGRRRIAFNDDMPAIPAGSELASMPGVPTNAVESVLVVVLPPGNYTAIVSSATAATGVALLEVTDLRSLPTTVPAVVAMQRAAAPAATTKGAVALAKTMPELCVAPLAAIVATR